MDSGIKTEDVLYKKSMIDTQTLKLVLVDIFPGEGPDDPIVGGVGHRHHVIPEVAENSEYFYWFLACLQSQTGGSRIV